jgi:hypothetical protein
VHLSGQTVTHWDALLCVSRDPMKVQWRNVLRGSVGVRSNLEAGGLRTERLVGSDSGPDNRLIGRVMQTVGCSLSVLGSESQDGNDGSGSDLHFE